jgi:hypothetical protein
MIMEERTQEEIEWYMERFTTLVQECQDNDCADSPHAPYRDVRVEKGRKYWKIMIDETDRDDHRSTRTRVFGFVRREDGAILRAANLKAPETRTKNPVRGYIWEETAGSTFSWTGINYDMGT